MKKLATLLLTAGLVFASVTGAFAIDFKAKGEWIMSFDYGQGAAGYSETRTYGAVYGSGFGNLAAPTDNFDVRQRVRLQLDAVASESLSGTVFFELGNGEGTEWGKNSAGGALGADGRVVALKQAYIDWIVPSTDIKVRMGIQGIALPSFTTGGSQVFDNDVAGIVVSNKFNVMFSLTAFWARPYNDNFVGIDLSGNEDTNDLAANYLDNTDIFGLLLPMTFDGFKLTPWVTYTMVGKNYARDLPVYSAGISIFSENTLPFGSLSHPDSNAFILRSKDTYDELFPYGEVWNVGLTGEITAADPLRIAWDFNYGFANFGHRNNVALGNYVRSQDPDPEPHSHMLYLRQGFYASLLFEYKMDWGTPGLYGWYSSGDDGDPFNGSERMPILIANNADNQFSNFAGSGNPYIARESVLGSTLIGTWGLGIHLKDVSFIEDLKHTFRVNYFQGTNDTKMARYIRHTHVNRDASFAHVIGGEGYYLTFNDYAFEFGLTTDYQIYENLKLYVDAGYLALHFDQDSRMWGDSFTLTDAWNINVSFVYSF